MLLVRTQPVPALGRVKRDDGWDEGVCDVVPEFHAPTGTVLALGHSVCYRGPRLSVSSHRAGRYTRSGAKANGVSDAGLTGTIHADRSSILTTAVSELSYPMATLPLS